jgi:hypothetical protein
VVAYCDLIKLDDAHEREQLLAAVVLLDNAWLEAVHLEAEAATREKRTRGRKR